jgi:predicted lipoprotein with Yx(FWY)xxD motif
MKNHKAVIAATAATILSLAAVSATSALAAGGGWGSTSSGSTAQKSSSSGTVHVVKSSDGAILVNSKGLTLYMFSADAKNKDNCIKQSGCASNWPPLTVSGKPTAGSGAKASLLGTISISGGKKQVTYAGHPLYTFTGDSSPAATDYIGQQGFGGTWYGVSASGSAVK